MRRSSFPLAILALTLCGCGTPPPITSPGVTASPTPSGTPTASANATCNELSFYLDPLVASGYTCETVPASNDEFEPWPQHTEVTLQGYPLSGTFFAPHISVFPVADYAALVPDAVPGYVAEMDTLTSGAATPVFAGSFSIGLPFLPVFNAAQAFFARYAVVAFVGGSGYRVLTEIAQYAVPVNNADLFYTYQALTQDGTYWISVTLPISLAALPADPEAGFGGQTQEQFSNGYEPYITAAVGQLEAAAPASFTPTIDALDALVSSITIEP